MIYENIYQTIGNTPLVKLNKLTKLHNIDANIYTKIESFNPSGSVKDRAAYAMIQDGLNKGLINQDTLIIENTSGNTGIGLSMICASLGLKLMIVMPDTMSVERIKMMQAYGTEIVLTPGKLGMQGTLDKVEQLKDIYPNHFIPQQFSNNANKLAHYQTTGPEIFKALNGHIDYFIAGVGTGGTLSGTGKYLKEQNNSIQVIAVEPASSPLLSQGTFGPHKIQGIGANFIPDILEPVYDQVFTVENDDAITAMKQLTKHEGIFAGISSGAALKVALDVAKQTHTKGNIVVILPDSQDRYLSLI